MKEGKKYIIITFTIGFILLVYSAFGSVYNFSINFYALHTSIVLLGIFILSWFGGYTYHILLEEKKRKKNG